MGGKGVNISKFIPGEEGTPPLTVREIFADPQTEGGSWSAFMFGALPGAVQREVQSDYRTLRRFSIRSADRGYG